MSEAKFERTAKQLELRRMLSGPQRNCLAYGGSRSGKTFGFVDAICTRAINAPGSRHGIFRYRFNAVKTSIMMDTFPKVMRLAFPGVETRVNKQEGFAEIVTNEGASEVWFGGLDDKERTEKILGMEFCVSPDSLVLMADLTWRRAEDVAKGDEVVAFPEDLSGHMKLERGVVEFNKLLPSKRRYRVVTTRGETIVSEGHKFVAYFDDRRVRNFSPLSWRAVEDLKPGDLLRFSTAPWTTDKTWGGGWLAGMFDGEGWVTAAGQAGVAQNEGIVLEQLKTLLNDRGISFGERSSQKCKQLIANSLWDAMRAIGSLRPYRLLRKSNLIWEGKRGFMARGDAAYETSCSIKADARHVAQILSIEQISDGPVRAIQTSTKTFISDGFCSHNCTIYTNEASQVPYESYILLQTRLAQNTKRLDGRPLALKNYVDLNPTVDQHWTYQLWQAGVEPISKEFIDKSDYAFLVMNPFDNVDNLAPEYLDSLSKLPERQRRRFLEGQYQSDVEGALWRRQIIGRVAEAPRMRRVVVALDPAVSTNVGSDETGIVVCGVDEQGRGIVLADESGKFTPEEWARRAVGLYRSYEADRIVYEANQGGDMVDAVIRAQSPNIPTRSVRATRGKFVRAEPVAALYEREKVFHAGVFDRLEDQMCLAAGTLVETQRGQVPIERVKAGDMAMTRMGFRPVKVACKTGCSSDFVVIETTDGRTLRCTPTHPIFDATSQEFVPAKNVQAGMILNASPNWASMDGQSHGAADGGTECHLATIGTQRESYSTARFGKRTSGRFLTAITSITKITTRPITGFPISCASLLKSTRQSIQSASHTLMGLIAKRMAENVGLSASGTTKLAFSAVPGSLRLGPTARGFVAKFAGQDTAPISGLKPATAPNAEVNSEQKTHAKSIAVKRVSIRRTSPESVYNLEVEDLPEYYANGILTHNCSFTADFDRSSAGYSPDRVDALVWAFTDLFPDVVPHSEPAPRRQPQHHRGAGSWMG